MGNASLKRRIRNGTLAMLAIALVLGAVALPQVYNLGGAIRDTLYRNYISIEAGLHMHRALYQLQLAEAQGRLATELKPNAALFRLWIDVELHDITEVGEDQLAHDIKARGERLLAALSRPAASGPGQVSLAAQFAALHGRIDDLIAMNRAAMFRANSRSTRLSMRLTTEFAIGLGALLLVGLVMAWTLAWSISLPLHELADRLRAFSLRGPSVRLEPQHLAELQAVAVEFNKMAERLEQFEKLNVDRLIYEKSKTEAILESLEDGIVLIDANGIITHINEVAAIILGVEREEALGAPIDDLNSNHPHYLRVRNALRAANSGTGPLDARLEVDLHVRGRDHTYVLKPVPLRHSDGQALGTLLILQDITYLRDKDRARTNLVATLSHELKTPLTSLALSAGLLERAGPQLAPKEQQLVETISEDIGRIRHLADDLLDLARGEGAAITLRTARLDLANVVRSVARGFELQAQQKHVALRVEAPPSILAQGDAVKLSWVISNLISNALRYTPAGGTVTVTAAPEQELARLEVSDDGPGIPPPLREHLFERFTQAPINGFEPGSAGLGLSIVKEIVEAHGGRIFVSSAEGGGTRFSLELPLHQENQWPQS